MRSGKGRTAHSGICAQTQGYALLFRSEMGSHDPARAKALLDLYGFIDRDGDGCRERPDGPERETLFVDVDVGLRSTRE